MRDLNKGDQIDSFRDFIANERPINWDDFHARGKTIFEESRFHILSEEQNYCCGYTEIYIDDLIDCHIDHYRKKSIFPALEFEWNNFIVATKDNEFGANHKDSVYKIHQDEYNTILNPAIDDVSRYFKYTEWGEIEANTDNLTEDEIEKANKTIEVFNLKHKSLTERRKDIINMIKSMVGQFTLTELKQHLSTSGFVSVLEQYGQD